MIQAGLVSLVYRGYELKRKADAAMLAGAIAAAEELKHRTQVNISAVGPPHSVPGEYPHNITGELSESARIVVDAPKKRAVVRFEAEHAPYVEEIRPFIDRSYMENRLALRRIAMMEAAKDFARRTLF